jgi:DNA modification methylase
VRAFRLTVNRSAAWAEWDNDLLVKEIEALLASGFNMTLTGFDQSELDKLLKEAAAVEPDPDAVPELPADPVVRQGELWLLGRHRLLCGDALNGSQVGHLLQPDRQVSMIWTDPPYNVAYEGLAGTIANDKMSAAEFDSFLYDAFTLMADALRPGGAIYVAHSETGGGLAFRQAFNRAGFHLSVCLIWKKNTAVMGRSDYHWQHEPILYGWKPGAAHRWHGDRKQKTIVEADLPGVVQNADGSWQILSNGCLYRLTGENLRLEEISSTIIEVDKPNRSAFHPTTKPVALIELMIRNSSAFGDTVLDPFGGSGSTLMACERLNRGCRIMDIDPRYAQTAIVRWQDYTGKQAVRESDGMLFDDLL